jgi:hypothetical protein
MGAVKQAMLEHLDSPVGKIEQIREYSDVLTPWEEGFIRSVEGKTNLTQEQIDKLYEICEECEQRAYEAHMMSKDD